MTATVTGGTAPQQCKWLVTTDPTWATYSVLHDLAGLYARRSPGPPPSPASYQVGVWARSSGTTADTPQASAGLSFTITGLPVTVTATPPSPRLVGTPITLTASVTGGTAPQQCKWFVTTDNWDTSSLLREWQACSTALPWTPTVPGSYQVGVWARSSGTTADAPQGSAGLAYEIVPNILGTYTGSGGWTNSGCTDPRDNETGPLSGTLTIATQSLHNFSGGGNINVGTHNVPVTLSGTVTGAGQVSGTLNSIDGTVSGTLNLTGTLVGRTLSFTVAGQTQEGGHPFCSLTATFTGTRP